jgi:hypothetical protein
VITADDLHWHHAGTDAFAIVNTYTITDAILRDRNANPRYAIYTQIDGDEVHLTSYHYLDDIIDYLNEIA